MRQLFICIVAVFCTVTDLSSQITKDSSAVYSKEYIDSLLNSNDTLMKEFEAFVDSLTGNKSYFDISTGIGNRLFSLRNNAFNSQQVSTNKLTLTPTIGYYHKSGLGLSWTSFLVFDSARTGFAQHTITPSYDFTKSDAVAFGVSYTHYFINEDNAFSASPFQNELYGYVTAKKGWLQPGIAAGWGKGNYREAFETSRTFDTVINGVLRKFTLVRRDTVKTTITDFSLMGTLKHDFQWYEIFGKNDDISFTPLLMITAGVQKYAVAQTTSRNGILRPRLFKTVRSSNENGSTGFRLQSAGLNLTATYTTGKFYISPQYYLDYYLPNDLYEGDKRTTSVFTVTMGVSF